MPVLVINSLEQIQGIIKEDKPVVIDFWAEWCGPCKAISPLFEKLSDEPAFCDVVFAKVNIDDVESAAEGFGIKAIPTFKYFNGGEKVGETAGANPQALQALVSQAAGK